jgi:hypothetical protein
MEFSYLHHQKRDIQISQPIRVFCAVPKICADHVEISKVYDGQRRNQAEKSVDCQVVCIR